MLKPNTYFFLYTLVTFFAIKTAVNLLPNQNILIEKFWVIFGFIATLTLLAVNICLYVIQFKTKYSTFIILGVNVIKLFFCMILVIFYLQIYTVKPILFIANFFLAYLLFTFFEIYTLLINLRHLNKKLKTSN